MDSIIADSGETVQLYALNPPDLTSEAKVAKRLLAAGAQVRLAVLDYTKRMSTFPEINGVEMEVVRVPSQLASPKWSADRSYVMHRTAGGAMALEGVVTSAALADGIAYGTSAPIGSHLVSEWGTWISGLRTATSYWSGDKAGISHAEKEALVTAVSSEIQTLRKEKRWYSITVLRSLNSAVATSLPRLATCYVRTTGGDLCDMRRHLRSASVAMPTLVSFPQS